jgi:hypothetical protein
LSPPPLKQNPICHHHHRNQSISDITTKARPPTHRRNTKTNTTTSLSHHHNTISSPPTTTHIKAHTKTNFHHLSKHLQPPPEKKTNFHLTVEVNPDLDLDILTPSTKNDKPPQRRQFQKPKPTHLLNKTSLLQTPSKIAATPETFLKTTTTRRIPCKRRRSRRDNVKEKVTTS